MASRRVAIIVGGALAGTLLLGTAGLALAQDPTPSPSQVGAGMMGGGASMMSGQMGAGMMGGGASMMSDQMGAGAMTSEQIEQMDGLHDQMVANGTCDPAQMQALHDQHHPDD